MKNLSKREKILIVVLISCGIIFVYLKLFLSPILDDYSKLNSKINSYKMQIDIIKATSINNRKLEGQLSDLQIKLNDAMKSLPLSERNPEVSYNIKQFADKNKVIINDITFGKAVNYEGSAQFSNKINNNNLMLLPVAVNVSGDYNAIINFVASIEKGNRIANISSLSFTLVGNNLQANINTNFYFMKSSIQDKYDYDFNKGSYGKNDIFR